MPTEYWYNTETGAVEEGHRSDWSKLMGPYATPAEAQHALEKAQARTQAWDKEDEERR